MENAAWITMRKHKELPSPFSHTSNWLQTCTVCASLLSTAYMFVPVGAYLGLLTLHMVAPSRFVVVVDFLPSLFWEVAGAHAGGSFHSRPTVPKTRTNFASSSVSVGDYPSNSSAVAFFRDIFLLHPAWPSDTLAWEDSLRQPSMSAPIAGRRKGIAPAATDLSATQAPTAESNMPDWLLGPEATPPPPTQRPATLQEPPLSTSATTPWLGAASSTKTAAPIPGFLGNDSSASQEPQHSSKSLTFLEMLESENDGGTNGRQSASQPSQAAVVEVPFSYQQLDHKEKLALVEELEQLSREEHAAREAVQALESGTHETCAEVTLLTAELHKYQEELKGATEQVASYSKTQDGEMSQRHAEEAQRLETSINAFRAELESQLGGSLTNLERAVYDTTEAVAAKRQLLEAMRERLSVTRNEGASQFLESRLVSLLRTMRSDFSLQVKPLLSRAIHDNFAEAHLQRMEIFTKDKKEQWDKFSQFRDERSKAREDFQSVQREAHVRAMDDVFGQLKRQWDTEKHRRETRGEEQLAAFRAAISATATQQSQLLETTTSSHLKSAADAMRSLDARYRTEERHLREKRAQELQLLQQRIQAELRTFMGSRKLASTGVPSLRFEVDVSCFEMSRNRLRSIKREIDTEAQLLKQRATCGSSNTEHLSIVERERAFDAQLAEMRGPSGRLDLAARGLHSALASIEEKIKTISTRTRDGRQRVMALREGTEMTRRTWERAALGELASAATTPSTSGALPRRDAWVVDLLGKTAERASRMLTQGKELRRAREVFTSAVGREVGKFEKCYSATTHRMKAIIELYEALRVVESHAEANRCVLAAAQNEFNAATAAVKTDHEQLEELRERIDGQLYRSTLPQSQGPPKILVKKRRHQRQLIAVPRSRRRHSVSRRTQSQEMDAIFVEKYKPAETCAGMSRHGAGREREREKTKEFEPEPATTSADTTTNSTSPSSIITSHSAVPASTSSSDGRWRSAAPAAGAAMPTADTHTATNLSSGHAEAARSSAADHRQVPASPPSLKSAVRTELSSTYSSGRGGEAAPREESTKMNDSHLYVLSPPALAVPVGAAPDSWHLSRGASSSKVSLPFSDEPRSSTWRTPSGSAPAVDVTTFGKSLTTPSSTSWNPSVDAVRDSSLTLCIHQRQRNLSSCARLSPMLLVFPSSSNCTRGELVTRGAGKVRCSLTSVSRYKSNTNTYIRFCVRVDAHVSLYAIFREMIFSLPSFFFRCCFPLSLLLGLFLCLSPYTFADFRLSAKRLGRKSSGSSRYDVRSLFIHLAPPRSYHLDSAIILYLFIRSSLLDPTCPAINIEHGRQFFLRPFPSQAQHTRYYNSSAYAKRQHQKNESHSKMLVDLEIHNFLGSPSAADRLFERSCNGITIPSGSSFHCRLYTTSSDGVDSLRSPRCLESCPEVTTLSVPFRSVGEERSLCFYHKQFSIIVERHEKLVVALKPDRCDASVAVAHGTLDPYSFLDRPKKDYSMKLRDTQGHRVGHLFFSLEVGPYTPRAPHGGPLFFPSAERQRGSQLDRGPSATRRHDGDRSTKQSNGNLPLKRNAGPAPVPERETCHATSRSPRRHPPRSAERTRSAPRAASPSTRNGKRRRLKFGIILERFHVPPSSLSHHAPPPLSLGEAYQLQLRYGSSIVETPHVRCVTPNAVSLKNFTAELDMPTESSPREGLPCRVDARSPLRFALWMGRTQVASFTLNPSKFRVRVGEEKAYTVPFHYWPTEHLASLEVRVFLYVKRRIEEPQREATSQPVARRTPEVSTPRRHRASSLDGPCHPVHQDPSTGAQGQRSLLEEQPRSYRGNTEETDPTSVVRQREREREGQAPPQPQLYSTPYTGYTPLRRGSSLGSDPAGDSPALRYSCRPKVRLHQGRASSEPHRVQQAPPRSHTGPTGSGPPRLGFRTPHYALGLSPHPPPSNEQEKQQEQHLQRPPPPTVAVSDTEALEEEWRHWRRDAARRSVSCTRERETSRQRSSHRQGARQERSFFLWVPLCSALYLTKVRGVHIAVLAFFADGLQFALFIFFFFFVLCFAFYTLFNPNGWASPLLCPTPSTGSICIWSAIGNVRSSFSMEGVFSTSLVICRSLCFAAVVLIFLVSLGGDVARGEDCYSSYAYFRWAMTEECGSHYNSATQTQVFNLGVYSGLQQHVKDLPYHIEEKSFAGSAIATDTVTSEMNKVFQPGDRTLLVVIGMAYYDGVRQDMTTNQMELNSRNVKDYVDIAPFIYGDVFRTWSQMEYYGRAEELMEAVLATRYAVNVLRAKRIFLSGDGLTTTYTQYYTVTNIGSSPKQFKFELTFLRSAGYADGVDTGVCTWSSTSYDSTFVSKNPQVLIMIHTDEGFVTANTKNAKLPNLITISGFYFLGRTLNIIMSVPHAANFAQRLFTTTTSHTAAQVEYQYIQKFRDDYNRTFGPSEHIGLRSPDHMLYSVAGWLQSMLMIEILMDPSWWCTRSNLRNKLFGPQQSRLCYYYGNLAPVPLLTSLLRYTSADLAGMSVGEDYMQLLSGLELVPMSNVNASVSLETRTVSLDSSNDAAAVTADLSNYATRVVLGSATTSVDLSSVLQVGVLKPGVDEAEYEKMNIHVTPTIGPTFYNVIGLAVQAKDGPEQAYQYCLPVTFKRVDGGSMPAAAEASRKLWNCPAPTSGVSSDGYGTDHVTLVVGTVEVMQVRSSTTTKIPELKPHKSSTAEPTTTTTTTTRLLLLLAFLVVWACCYTSASGFEDMEPWRPLTTLVVSYDDVMCNSLSLAGVRVAEKLHERLERVIRKSFVAHGVHEVRSTGSSLYGLSHDCCAALECSREIQRSVASLESSFPLSLGMGLATGLLQGQRDEKTKEMAYFGSSMTLAERIATQLSKGVIVAHGTSWYALSVTEGASIPVSGPHRRRVEDAVSLFDISRRLPEEELYLIDTTNTKAEEWKEEAPVQPHGEESAPRATSMLAAAPPDTAVNHALNLQWCFERLPVIHRIVLLESLLRHWRQPLPVREAYVSDEGYYKALLDALFGGCSSIYSFCFALYMVVAMPTSHDNLTVGKGKCIGHHLILYYTLCVLFSSVGGEDAVNNNKRAKRQQKKTALFGFVVDKLVMKEPIDFYFFVGLFFSRFSPYAPLAYVHPTVGVTYVLNFGISKIKHARLSDPSPPNHPMPSSPLTSTRFYSLNSPSDNSTSYI
eukprot:gene6712-4809_t